MSARARVELDFPRGGVAIHVSPRDDVLMSFGHTSLVARTEAGVVPDAEPLLLAEDTARAIYQALGEYFGGMAADQRLLRRDYEDERKRVDTFIAHLTGRTR